MIVDASVAFKWFSPEDDSEIAVALLARNDLAAPGLLLIEVGNALWTKARREQIDATVSFAEDVDGLAGLVSIRDEASLIGRALEIARLLDHPIYDCVYLALAESSRDQLMTADRRFAGKATAGGFGHVMETLA